MAKIIIMGVIEGVQILTSKAGKVYGYNLGISSMFTNKYGQSEKRIVDVRYSDRTKMDVERAVSQLINKEVYLEAYVTANEFSGKVRVEYNYQPDTPIIDANTSDPYGTAKLAPVPSTDSKPKADKPASAYQEFKIMTLCVVQQPDNSLLVSSTQPCDGFYLVDARDLQGQLSASEVLLLFGAAASLYAVVFVFKIARRQFGF